MESRAAGHNVDVPQIVEDLVGEAALLQPGQVALDPGGDGVPQGLGLLHDLLDHKVLIASLFRRGNVPVHRLHFGFQLLAEGVEHLHRIRRDAGDLVVFQHDIVLGFLDDGGDVGGDQVLPFAHADDQRVVPLGAVDLAGVVGRQNAQSIAAPQILHGVHQGLHHISLEVVLKQMSHHFGVGLGLHLIALFGEHFPQFQIVFDDAVVDDGDPSIAADVGMGIHIGRLTMGGPPGVTDAAGGFHAAHLLHLVLQVLDTALGLDHLQPFGAQHRHTGGVIPTVLQLIQSLQQNGHGLFPAHISYDSAHKNFSSKLKLTPAGMLSRRSPALFLSSASWPGVNAQGASAEWFDPPPPRQLPAGSPGAFFFASALARPHRLSIAWAFSSPYPRQKPGIWV